VAIGDYLGTGRPSIWVTNYENELHALYRNECQGENIVFGYSSPAAGIAAFGQTYVGWGTAFLDLDRDGWDDLVSANGHPNYFPRSGPKEQLPLLLRNTGQGQFKRLPAAGGDYFQTPHHGRGLAAGDLDNDGQPDLVISHLNQPVVVLRGAAPPRTHWAGFELVGRKHRSIAGAKVTVEAGARQLSKFVSGGGSYLSDGDPRALVGLGAAPAIDRVIVAWPWGEVESWGNIAADRYTRLVEGTGVKVRNDE
jgi:enediyne biosynthesis protein E4